jgi:hypothetical protein
MIMSGMLWLLLLVQDYDSQQLDFDYIDAVRIEDMNGDGRPDLIVQSGLDLKIYFQNDQSRYGETPDVTLRFDERTFLWMLRKNEKGKYDLNSIHTMSSRGIHRLHVDSGKVTTEDLIVHPTVFEGKPMSANPPPYLDFSPDLNGDGVPDFVLFTRSHLFLMVQEKGEWVLRDKIDIGIEPGMAQWIAAYQPVTWSAVVPRFVVGDVNGDKRPDLVVYKDEQASVWIQGEDGHFQAQPKLTLPRKRHGRRRGLVQVEVPPAIEDVNGDGVLDIAYTEPTKGRVYVRYGIAGRADLSDPLEWEIPDSWNLGTQFVDVDGKGPRRMILWTVPKLGLSSGIEAFVSKKITIEGYFFESVDQGRIAAAAKTKVSLSIPFTIYFTRNSTGFPVDLLFEPNFECDLNRDGLKDLMVAVGGTLYVHYGSPKDVFSSEANFKMALNPPTPTSHVKVMGRDMNGDGKDDIVVVHTDPVNEKARIEIKFSK